MIVFTPSTKQRMLNVPLEFHQHAVLSKKLSHQDKRILVHWPVFHRHYNAHESLVELLAIMQEITYYHEGPIALICPFLPYARDLPKNHQDNLQNLMVHKVARLLQDYTLESIDVLDIHNLEIMQLYTVPFFSHFPDPLLFKDQSKNLKDCVIVAPDAGAQIRCTYMAKALGIPVIFLTKKRLPLSIDVAFASDDDLDVIKGRHCILVDDMVETGNTLVVASAFLKKQGALSVDAWITHFPMMDLSCFDSCDRIICTDSIGSISEMKMNHNTHCVLSVVSIESWIKECINRIMERSDETVLGHY